MVLWLTCVEILLNVAKQVVYFGLCVSVGLIADIAIDANGVLALNFLVEFSRIVQAYRHGIAAKPWLQELQEGVYVFEQ